MKVNKKIIISSAVALVALVSVLGFVKQNSAIEKPDQEMAGISVAVQTLKPETMEAYISLSTKVVASGEVAVYPKVSGTVTKTHVNIGDTVKAGDILFEIDDTAYKLQATQAQAQLTAAKANYDMNIGANLENQMQQLESSVESTQIQYDDLKLDYENAKSLHAAGAMSKKDLDTLKSNLDKLSIQLNSAKDSLRRAKESTVQATKAASNASVQQASASAGSANLQLNYTKVTAPIDGVVSSFSVTEGMMVSPQTQGIVIVDNSALKVNFSVTDEYINRLKPDSKVYVNVGAVKDKVYEGQIKHISPAASSTTLLYPVEAELLQSDSQVKSGMFASVKVVVDQIEQALCLPINAVISKGDETYVFVVSQDGKAEKRLIETGISNEEKIQITKGLQVGEQVIIKGQTFVKDKDTVNVAKDK